ncbi:phosphatase PAP2 family protein [Actinoplanes sp. NPDC051851]|uniref:phosphatase PAP2 family protein n=1 Tax=Actinoplanes sp. NPDC051851 TaxID=3154753 RepID=UPI00341962C7
MRTRTSTRSSWHAITPLLVAILAAATAYAIWWIFIRTSLGQSIDSASMHGGDVHHPQITQVLSRALNATQLAALAVVCVLAAIVGALRRRFDLSAGAFFLVATANIAVQQFKSHLDRPDLDGFAMPNSFPSGHTAAAASVAFVLVMVFPQALRGTVALIGAAYVTLVAIATVWAAWHRPSDTIAALMIVLACGSVVAWVTRLSRAGVHPPVPAPARLTIVPLALTAAIATAVAVIGLAAVAVSERVLPDFVSGRYAFLTGVAGIVAAVATTFSIWVRLIAGDPQGGKS